MKFSVVLAAAAALFLPAFVNAQYPPDYSDTYPATETYPTTETYPESGTMTYPESSGAPTSSSTPSSTNVDVQVAAGGQLVYSPSNFTAANGTTVTFWFSASFPHSVTQGSFADPCVYLAASGGEPAGFDSGLQSAGEEFVLTIVNDQIPVWFFCKNSDHCGLGMVGSINAPATGNTYDAWLAAAKALGANEVPITDNGPVTGGVGAVATGTPFPSTAVAAAASATSTGANPTTSTASATHIVANGFFALLVAAFAIRLA